MTAMWTLPDSCMVQYYLSTMIVLVHDVIINGLLAAQFADLTLCIALDIEMLC